MLIPPQPCLGSSHPPCLFQYSTVWTVCDAATETYRMPVRRASFPRECNPARHHRHTNSLKFPLHLNLGAAVDTETPAGSRGLRSLGALRSPVPGRNRRPARSHHADRRRPGVRLRLHGLPGRPCPGLLDRGPQQRRRRTRPRLAYRDHVVLPGRRRALPHHRSLVHRHQVRFL